MASEPTSPVQLILGAESRELRHALRPVRWAVLEEVALDVVVEGNLLVARTSARMVAERLGINPETAVTALRLLRRRRLLTLRQDRDLEGRFGLSAYVVSPVPGLAVVPCAESPRTAPPPATSSRPRGAGGVQAAFDFGPG